MARLRPPKGYRQTEYPLPHSFGQKFVLEAEDETKNSTYVTLFRATESAVDVENIEVNPRHASFAQDGGTAIHMGSIVPKVNLTIHASMTKLAIETDKMRSIRFTWMPVYISFLNTLEAEDDKTGVQVEDILELVHDVTNKDTTPLFSTVNLSAIGSQPFSTVPYSEVFGDFNLSVDSILESVAFDEELFFDALQFNTNKGMLSKVIGPRRSVTVTRDRPYTYHSNNFTYPAVKRGNPYTYCGILFHLPQAGSANQFFEAADTTAIPHLNFGVNVRFNEWNPFFQQAAI